MRNIKKLSRTELSKLNGGLLPGQCMYKDPVTGRSTIGCLVPQRTLIDGVWVYTDDGVLACSSCIGD